MLKFNALKMAPFVVLVCNIQYAEGSIDTVKGGDHTHQKVCFARQITLKFPLALFLDFCTFVKFYIKVTLKDSVCGSAVMLLTALRNCSQRNQEHSV